MIHAPPSDEDWVAGILAVAGFSCGGVILEELACRSFVQAYSLATGVEKPFRNIPASISLDDLTGTLDLAATLALGRPVRSEGLLGDHSANHILIRRPERLEASSCAYLADAIDVQQLCLVSVVTGGDEDEVLNARLADRLAFRIDRDVRALWSDERVQAAREMFARVGVAEGHVSDLVGVAIALGVGSPRSVLHAIHASRAIAALKGLRFVDQEIVALAARLVFAHRAQRLPDQQPEQETQSPDQTRQPEADQHNNGNPTDAEVVMEAVVASIPPHLLQQLSTGLGKKGSARSVKAKGAAKAKTLRGRRVGSKRATSLSGQRLDILSTLRRAAPWQVLRQRLAQTERMIVTRDDFQIHRVKQRNESTAIFAVDASGSTAFQRLAEAKGAVEAVLAECYVRRDKVALVSFRSKGAEELLPPTRSLERARRALAALPGGGGTPLAAGLDKTLLLVDQIKRSGATPVVIVLTDGRANVTREGEGNKVKALEESQAAARLFQMARVQSMVIDVSPEPQRHARSLAEAMGAAYFAMPRAQAADIVRPVTQALRSTSK